MTDPRPGLDTCADCGQSYPVQRTCHDCPQHAPIHAAECLATPAPAPALLALDYRCRRCGSPYIEWEGWNYGNLPLNDSEGSGRAYCGTCEDDDARSNFDAAPDELPGLIAEWIAYRAEHGLDTLQESDAEFLRDLAGQCDKLEQQARDTRAEWARLIGPRGRS